jgi:hypothetical protein
LCGFITYAGGTPSGVAGLSRRVACDHIDISSRAGTHLAEPQFHADATLDERVGREHLRDNDATDEHAGPRGRDVKCAGDGGHSLFELLDIRWRFIEPKRVESGDGGAFSGDGFLLLLLLLVVLLRPVRWSAGASQ